MAIAYRQLSKEARRDLIVQRLAELERFHVRALLDRDGLAPEQLPAHEEAIARLEAAHARLTTLLEAMR